MIFSSAPDKQGISEVKVCAPNHHYYYLVMIIDDFKLFNRFLRLERSFCINMINVQIPHIVCGVSGGITVSDNMDYVEELQLSREFTFR